MTQLISYIFDENETNSIPILFFSSEYICDYNNIEVEGTHSNSDIFFEWHAYYCF